MTSPRLRRLAERVGAFWGEGLDVVVDEGAPRFDWRRVLLTPETLHQSDDEVLCLLLHEWGHRCIAPITLEQGLWWQCLARQEGIRAARDACNIACDLLVDRWYVEHPLWGDTYRRVEGERLERLAARDVAKLAQRPVAAFLVACYEGLGKWPGLGHLPLDRPQAQRALAALFDAGSSLEDRVAGFFNAAAPVFERERSAALRGDAAGTAVSPLLLGSALPWRTARWDAQALVRLIAASGRAIRPELLQEVCGGAITHGVRAELRLLESLVRVRATVERAVRSRPGIRQEGVEPWRPGDSLRRLDAVKSLEQAGILLPGLTTLKRRLDSPREECRFPRLCLVIDNSGSTAGQILDAELDAAIALLESARRLGADAGCVVFGTSVQAVVPPGPNHAAIGRLLASLHGEGGGTELAPALAEACAMLPSEEHAMATVVFTDSWIHDAVAALPFLTILGQRGPVAVFMVEQMVDASLIGALRSLPKAPALIQFRPGQPIADQALELIAPQSQMLQRACLV